MTEWEYAKSRCKIRAENLEPVQRCIKEYRKSHGLSLVQMAIQTGYSATSIFNWERGYYKAPERLIEFVRENDVDN